MDTSSIPLSRSAPDVLIAIPPRRSSLTASTELPLPPPPSIPRGLPAKRLFFALLIVLAVTVTVRLGHEWWTTGRFIESTDDAYVGGEVTVIAPKVPGFIMQVAVSDNQAVHAGDVLVKLEDRDYRAALAKADAVVAIQEAALDHLEATRHLQEAMVAQAEAEITAVEAEIVRSRDDQTRYQWLVRNAAVSTQSFQKADAEYKQAQALGTKALAGLTAAQRQLEVIGTQKKQTWAMLAQAKAERDMAQLNLEYTLLRAPIDGIIGNRSARAGAYATTGAQLISLVPASGLWIDANFKESQIARMHAGQPATIFVDQCPDRVFHGQVGSIAPATGAQFSVLPPENATGNFTKIVQRVAVRIVLDEEAAVLNILRPGLSATVEVNGKPPAKIQP
ncbi:MAG: Membrane fusion component of tripartite multidrug resistance system [Verrucomicrobiaceae bacterium]|nr:Membrane fusion component of tripartite multidrug resistance system [Verrucomicrobiaceae bacterium]